jgi:hypothetical protein
MPPYINEPDLDSLRLRLVEETASPTNIYTLEYDGFSDFPRYPINFLTDLTEFLSQQNLPGPEGVTPGSTIKNLYIDFFKVNDSSQGGLPDEIFIDNVRVDGKAVTTEIMTIHCRIGSACICTRSMSSE